MAHPSMAMAVAELHEAGMSEAMSDRSKERRRERRVKEHQDWGQSRSCRAMFAPVNEGIAKAAAILKEQGFTPTSLLAASVAVREGDLLQLQHYKRDRDRLWQHQAPKIACREGCSWCCRGPQVLASAHEVLDLAAWMKEHFSAEEIQATHERIASAILQFDRECEGHDPLRPAPRITCPLLQDDRCSVYPARPLPCRGWHSLDVARCQAYAAGDDFATCPSDAANARTTPNESSGP